MVETQEYAACDRKPRLADMETPGHEPWYIEVDNRQLSCAGRRILAFSTSWREVLSAGKMTRYRMRGLVAAGRRIEGKFRARALVRNGYISYENGAALRQSDRTAPGTAGGAVRMVRAGLSVQACPKRRPYGSTTGLGSLFRSGTSVASHPDRMSLRRFLSVR